MGTHSIFLPGEILWGWGGGGYETSITLISKLDKDITGNKNNKPISFTECRRWNSQQKINKLNSTIIKIIISHYQLASLVKVSVIILNRDVHPHCNSSTSH